MTPSVVSHRWRRVSFHPVPHFPVAHTPSRSLHSTKKPFVGSRKKMFFGRAGVGVLGTQGHFLMSTPTPPIAIKYRSGTRLCSRNMKKKKQKNMAEA
mmetsp:Transcript_26354/g.57232  ORF Transcript_26354/g.57232 Transcript_26354/m.57232 type:complete len:97 (-) Transcript_26354:206-496(-)